MPRGEREGWHVHGDPLEQKTWEQLLELVRLGSLPIRRTLNDTERAQMHADEMNAGADERDDAEDLEP